MTPAVDLRFGDCLDVLRELDDESVSAIVTDPPYGLEFMGKDWDRPWAVGMSDTGYTDGSERLARPSFGDSRNANCRTCKGRQRGDRRCTCDTPNWDRHPREDMRAFQQWCEEWAGECLRVLKPGGHMLAFGGSRTFHRLAAGIEDAGFEIRDTIMWLYGSGMPKGISVSKAIDKMAGAEREAVSLNPNHRAVSGVGYEGIYQGGNTGSATITAPATPEAARWEGWNTALKPAQEPIIVARKPLAGTVAATVLAHGTGALNVDACRVGTGDKLVRPAILRTDNEVLDKGLGAGVQDEPAGRWPANVVLVHADTCEDGGACVDGCPVAELDAQSGTLKSGANPTRRGTPKLRDTYGEFAGQEECTPARGADEGGASRFYPTFRYQAKAPAGERPKIDGKGWPTVKPQGLMRWLVRLVTPPGGLVLDPFAGTASTLQAARDEGFDSLGIERDPFAYRLARQRLYGPSPAPAPAEDLDDQPGAPPPPDPPAAQLDLFGAAS